MWTVHTRPDIAYAASLCSQATENTFNADHHQLINRVVKYLHATSQRCLAYPTLDAKSLRLVVYSDVSFNNAVGNRSQLGYIITLADRSNRCAILHFRSYKSSRVTRSSTAGETLAFSDAFDHAYLMGHDLQRMLSQQVPILMMTDSEQLFHLLTRCRYTTERRLMVDISAAREAYNDGLISNVGLISSNYNPADGLTKLKSNGALQDLMLRNVIDHPVRQFVVR